MKDEETTVNIGPKTNLQLGLLMLLIATFGGGLWWAGNWTGAIQTKLDIIISQMKVDSDANASTRAQVSDLAARIRVIETIGSTHAQDLEKRLNELSREFDAHKFRDPNSPAKP